MLNGFDVGGELYGVVVPYVEDAPRGVAGGWVRGVAVPVLIGLCNIAGAADDAFDDIFHIGEVACVIAVVKDRYGLTGQDFFGEKEQRHVWSAPRTVDREEAQASGGQAEQVAVAMGHQLVGALGGSVKLQRVHRGLVLTEWHIGVRAVNAAGAGVCEVRRLLVTAGLQDIGESVNIAAGISTRVFKRVTHSGLGSQVDDAVELVLGEAVVNSLLFGKVCSDAGIACAGFGSGLVQKLKARFLDAGVVVVIDFVEPNNRLPLAQ